MKILSSLLPAIINDDCTGLTEGEIKQVQTFVDQYPACIFNNPGEAFFDTCDLTGIAGDCVEVSITRPRFKTRYINRRRGAAIETIEEVTNFNYTNRGFVAELARLVAEYSLSDPTAYYYVSNRSTAAWRAK